jgi:hypothetical protein
MAQRRYGAVPVTSNAGVVVSTGTALKTIIQVATPATTDITVISWWISFDGTTGVPIKVELVEVDVAATVTALTPVKYSDPNAVASLCVSGTSATGYNASAEGTVTASRLLDWQLVSPTSGVIIQFPLGREPGAAASKFLRLRTTAAASVNAAAGIVWEE